MGWDISTDSGFVLPLSDFLMLFREDHGQGIANKASQAFKELVRKQAHSYEYYDE